ncbi:phosphatidate cytidylyltransferase [bacterium]|nr:phosphatidate cytidylyltransferase [bacterium]
MWDSEVRLLFLGIVAVLVVATVIGQILRRTTRAPEKRKSIENLNARTFAWWMMVAVVFATSLIGPTGTILLFVLISFQALRELFTMTPTRREDHRALFWVFFVIMPIHYLLIGVHWYGLFAIFIPVYAFLFLPIRQALAGETRDFLGRASRVQWGLMICVYCISHVPALLMLDMPGYAGQNPKLFLFLVIVVQMSDVLQYVFGKVFGRHKLIPKLSPNKTWEGLVGGVASASLLGACLHFITPFSTVSALLLAAIITLMGFFGGIVFSALKRDAGLKDFGTILPGHGGMLDRIDSLVFAAPVFFHLVRYFYT